MKMRHSGNSLRKLFAILNRPQRKRVSGIIALQVIAAIMETGIAAAALLFMNLLMLPDTIEYNKWAKFLYDFLNCGSVTELLAYFSGIMALGYAIKGSYKILTARVMHKFIRDSEMRLSTRLFDCYLHKPFEYHANVNSADIVKAVTGDVSIVFGLVNSLMGLIAELLVALFLAAFMFTVNWKISMAAGVLIVLLAVLLNKGIKKRVADIGVKNRSFLVRMLKEAYQALGGLKGIYVNRRQQFFINSYAQSAAGYAQNNNRLHFLAGIPGNMVESLSMTGVFLIVSTLVLSGTNIMDILPALATFAIVVMRIVPSVKRISESFNSFVGSRSSLDTVYDSLIDSGINLMSEEDVIRPVRPKAETKPLEAGVVVEHLTFRYKGAPSAVLEDVSFTIPSQKSVAFIGRTGEGKTTLADIILGLQTPQSGSVTADGHNIHREPEWWAERVGYVPQSVYLSDDTIRQNVAFGYSPEDIDDSLVWECLEEAHVADFVRGLPEGLETLVGEQGVKLSGGQRQRIGIARALYGKPQFLVLDEATSSLDNETERAIIKSIDSLSGRMTVLIIAHRLSTIQNCDIIYRVEKKKVLPEPKVQAGI